MQRPVGPRVVLLAIGAVEQVVPMLAFGILLQKKNGFAVTLAAAPEFREMAEELGLNFSVLNGSIEVTIAETQYGRQAREQGGKPSIHSINQHSR